MHEDFHLVKEDILDGLTVRFRLLYEVHSLWDPVFSYHSIRYLLTKFLALGLGYMFFRFCFWIDFAE